MTRVPLWSLAFLLATAPRLAGQSAPDERWQVTLDDGRYVWDIRLVKLEGDSLVVRQSDSLLGVPVAHITEVRLIRKSEVQMGGGGDMAGAMSALMGGDDEVYDLSPLEFAERMRTIQKILLNHPAAP
ncbi:MAG TPA: hypothetical protein VHR41_09180 [Gemmatimonadales bacterium]|jgi:hypothetical protein|nr:hypothetical protein [Gemmatimonadales bacterium]